MLPWCVVHRLIHPFPLIWNWRKILWHTAGWMKRFRNFYIINCMPDIFIIAGCNGAGKTTAAYNLLPEVFKTVEFVNAHWRKSSVHDGWLDALYWQKCSPAIEHWRICAIKTLQRVICPPFVYLWMSKKYKFSDNSKLYFVSFAVTNWIDLFIRNEYKDIFLLPP